jgi:hypothetical protein
MLSNAERLEADEWRFATRVAIEPFGRQGLTFKGRPASKH